MTSHNINDLRAGDAVIVVDVQNDFCPGGALAVPDGDEVVPVLNRWIRRAESAGVPVFFSRDWHPVNHISFADRGGPWPRHCVQDTPGAGFHPELAVPSDAVIISKAENADTDSYSAFGATTLAQQLKAKNIRRVWIGGLALDYCVLQTALDARREGFDVHLLLAGARAVGLAAEDAARAVETMSAAGVHIDQGD